MNNPSALADKKLLKKPPPDPGIVNASVIVPLSYKTPKRQSARRWIAGPPANLGSI